MPPGPSNHCLQPLRYKFLGQTTDPGHYGKNIKVDRRSISLCPGAVSCVGKQERSVIAKTPRQGSHPKPAASQSTARRLKATIVGDVVGYSRLIEADDVGTLDKLAVLRTKLIHPRVAKYDGLMRWSAGDHMVVLFDSVVDAVECACQIQIALEAANVDLPEDEEIRMRMGISFGDVILETDDVAGDSVNIAARLEGLSEPGGFAISEAAYGEVQHKVPLNYEEQGLRRLKNIDEPVRVYFVHAKDIGRHRGSRRSTRDRLGRGWRRLRRKPWTVAAITVFFLLVGLVPLLDQEVVRILPGYNGSPDQNAIAVLPFENLSDDPTQDHIARGIATDLIIDLSGIRKASIVARSSSFRYAQRPVDLTEVADLLGAKYVVDGTVVRAADFIRVNVLLMDAQSQRQIWAARFDGSTSELFAFQRRIAIKVLEALAIKFAEADRPAPRAQANFAVTDVFYAAREAYYRDQPEELAAARRMFQQILKANPDFHGAHAYLASIYWAGFDRDWAEKLDLDLQESLDLAWQHLSESLKAPTPLTYQVQARMLTWERDYAAALSAAEKAIQLDPNDPVGRLTMAIILIYTGQIESAFAYLERASSADPLNQASYLFWEGLAKYLLGDYAGAEGALGKYVEAHPGDDWSHLILAAALGQQGKTNEARAEIETVQKLRQKAGVPAYSLRHVQYWTFKRDSDLLLLCKGLAKTGLSGKCD